MAFFEVLKPAPALNPRLGSLSIPGKPAIPTPNYIANTSRGVVPHLSQDNLEKHTDINGLYLGLEDFIEKAPSETPPVFNTPTCSSKQSSPLRRFIAARDAQPLVLGPRRVPALDSPGSNTNAGIQVHTSVGHRALSSAYYAAAAVKLAPDVVVGLADVMPGHPCPSLKRVEKMGDRTAAWMRDLVAAVRGIEGNGDDASGCGMANGNGNANADGTSASSSAKRGPAIFAPILPIEPEQQSFYLSDLTSSPKLSSHLSGLALYSSSSLACIPSPLSHLPRLSLANPATPAQLLHAISLGTDIFVLPLVDAATDAGMALVFEFPAPVPSADQLKGDEKGGEEEEEEEKEEEKKEKTQKRPLALNAWDPIYATSPSPPQSDCPCYTCTRHSLAYLQHLLRAKEMLAWVLLSLHNHAVVSRLFSNARSTLQSAEGSDAFEAERARFERAYEEELPLRTGQGPRVRGYMARSRGPGEARRNERAFVGVGVGGAGNPGEKRRVVGISGAECMG
ncbi:tRNA-guanine transglycosylase family protein [Phyllosticta paracitricarpa]|uniref:Queuine tRNA-ribosyltransferase accessory subunit 2 n=2 Tax=Phyllosticta TaxID=121621 RepID=A0ABR1MS89_9PEZI